MADADHPPLVATGSRSLSQALREIPDAEVVTLGMLMDSVGTRAHGTAIMLLAIPDAIPLPIPSVSAILGVPLVLISAHLAIFGGQARVPERIRRWRVPRGFVRVLRGEVANALGRLERVSRPRWRWIAGQEHLIGLVCLLLALVLLMPLPLVNTPPSLCLALLAWGTIQRDGAFVLAGLAGAVALGAGLAWIGATLLGVVTG